MAYWSFTKVVLAGAPIAVFNHGRMLRDFTYIDDIVTGVLAVLDRALTAEEGARVLNISGHVPVPTTSRSCWPHRASHAA